MREIKFRAWDKDLKRMRSVIEVHTLTKRVRAQDKDNMLPIVLEEHEYELMQSTGLKDKNGNEIYEGDIVLNNEANWEIRYEDGAYRMGPTGRFLLMGEEEHSEVIGNIWEHPHLLKGQGSHGKL